MVADGDEERCFVVELFAIHTLPAIQAHGGDQTDDESAKGSCGSQYERGHRPNTGEARFWIPTLSVPQPGFRSVNDVAAPAGRF